jgi:hypothetical protein
LGLGVGIMLIDLSITLGVLQDLIISVLHNLPHSTTLTFEISTHAYFPIRVLGVVEKWNLLELKRRARHLHGRNLNHEPVKVKSDGNEALILVEGPKGRPEGGEWEHQIQFQEIEGAISQTNLTHLKTGKC